MIFITGATGFLGREVLGRLLVSRPGERIAVLVRPTRQLTAEARVKQLLREIFSSSVPTDLDARVLPVSGDLSQACFGLGEAEFLKLAGQTTEIFHCGASTNLVEPLETSRAVNVMGTVQTLEFASKASELGQKLSRLHHVSTAFVAGDVEHVTHASDLTLERQFRNGYERSKAEAEALVRDRAASIPVSIYRPSMIVGDSITGQTTAFNVIYIPARILMRGLASMVPARPNIPFDVVPVDYVADAMLSLAREQESIGSCYHLCAGVGRETSPKEILHCIVETFNKYRRRGLSILAVPTIIAPEVLHLAQSSFRNVKSFEEFVAKQFRLLRQVIELIPYLTRNPRFDTTSTTKVLAGIMEPPPLFVDYAEQVFRYCMDTNWGRKSWTNPGGLKSWHERLPESI